MLTCILNVWTSLLNMSWQMKIAFGCHFFATIIIGGLGYKYISSKEIMPYHKGALGNAANPLNSEVKVLILALMKALGSAAFAVVVLEFFLLFVPFTEGAVWAKLAIPAGGLVISVGALCVMDYVRRKAPGEPKPPWIVPLVAVGFFVMGLVFSLL